MARAKFPKPVGMNQLADETALTIEEVMYLRSARNVDIDAAGNISRRKGYEQILAGLGYHSLYSSKRGWLLFAYKENLGIFDPDTVTATPLAVMDEAYQVSYTEMNGNLYAMNPGWSAYFKPNDFTAYTIGVPLPIVQPQFTTVTTKGSLAAGSYGIAYSVVDPNGEESELSEIIQLDLEDRGAIVVTYLTLLAEHRYRIYMTTTDGEELYQTAEFAADRTYFEIMDHQEGRQPTTQNLEAAPKGHIIRSFNSRLLIGTTNYVFFTEAFRPHLYNPAHNWIKTTGFTTMVEPLKTGVYIADRRGVRFYAGEDPLKWEERDASADLVVYNTSKVVPGTLFTGKIAQFEEVVVWLSPKGFQVGLPTGEVIALNATQLKLPEYVQGCIVATVQDGRKQILSPVNSNLPVSSGNALDSTTI